MLARSFLIESSSKLLEIRTGINARTSLISGRTRLLTLELLVLEWRKFYTFELEYLCCQLGNLDQILCVASLGEGKDCIMLWGRLDQNTGVHATESHRWLIMGKTMSPPFLGSFWSDPFFLQVTRTCIKYRTSSNFGQIGPMTTELAALERLKISHRLIMGKWCLHASSVIFDRIINKGQA